MNSNPRADVCRCLGHSSAFYTFSMGLLFTQVLLSFYSCTIFCNASSVHERTMPMDVILKGDHTDADRSMLREFPLQGTEYYINTPESLIEASANAAIAVSNANILFQRRFNLVGRESGRNSVIFAFGAEQPNPENTDGFEETELLNPEEIVIDENDNGIALWNNLTWNLTENKLRSLHPDANSQEIGGTIKYTVFHESNEFDEDCIDIYNLDTDYMFEQGELIYIGTVMIADNFEKLQSMISKKYGDPGEVDDDTMFNSSLHIWGWENVDDKTKEHLKENLMLSTMATWKLDDGTIVLITKHETPDHYYTIHYIRN